MSRGRRSNQDVTGFFSSPEELSPEASEKGPEPTIGPGPFSFFDPSGMLEELSGGQIRDPLRHRILEIARRVRSYFSGNQP